MTDKENPYSVREMAELVALLERQGVISAGRGSRMVATAFAAEKASGRAIGDACVKCGNTLDLNEVDHLRTCGRCLVVTHMLANVTPTEVARAVVVYNGEYNRLRGQGDEQEQAMRWTLREFLVGRTGGTSTPPTPHDPPPGYEKIARGMVA